MKNIPYLFILLITQIISTNCHKSEAQNQVLANNQALDSSTDSSSLYAVNLGDSITIQLTSNPTTGYSWAWLNKSAGNHIVDTFNVKYIPDTPKSKGYTGYGGREIWHFKTQKKGETTVKLGYLRSWENQPPVAEKTLHITVK